MPIHDYVCRACGGSFETLVRGGAVPACPYCGAIDLARQISAPVAPGRSAGIIASARRQAAREGHLSNFSASELNKKPPR